MTFESQLLGCYLSGANIDPVVTEAMFHKEAHRIIFSAISKLKEQNIQPDISVLVAELEKRGEVDVTGGYDAIASLTNGAAPSNVAYYEAEVLREYQRRSAWKTAAKLQEDLKNNIALDQAVLDAVKQLSEMTTRPKTDDGVLFADLLQKQFPPDRWFVDNLIGPGLTVLTGASKIGKSWTALQLISAVDQGGYFLGKLKAQKADCLYLALEDTPKRIQRRLKKQGVTIFNGSRLETKRRNIGELKIFLKANSQFKLVLIDTFQKMMGLDDLNDYAKTVNGMSALKDVADSLGIAVVVVHHNRKGSALDTDFMESALGSTGINATADCTLTMRRKRGEANANLSVTGRDVEDASYTITWDKDICSWTITDQGELKPALTEIQQQILDLLASEDRNWNTAEIAGIFGIKNYVVSRHAKELADKGYISKPSYGQWCVNLSQNQIARLHSPKETQSCNLQKEGIPPEFAELFPQALKKYTEQGLPYEEAAQEAREAVLSFAEARAGS